MADYPEDSIQSLTPQWWQKCDNKTLRRGALVYAYVQFFSQVPFEIVAERVEANNHQTGVMRIRPLYTDGKRHGEPGLPVSAMPRLEGADCFIANRAKRRPCLVVGAVDRLLIDKRLTSGMAKQATHDFFLAAPFYSVAQKRRSGYNPVFVERIRHAHYARFFWDILPIEGGGESILRFDQMQPVGFHHQAYQHTGYELSKEALHVMEEWLSWALDGRLVGDVKGYKEIIDEEVYGQS